MKNQSNIQKNFDGITLNVTPDERFGFIMTADDVAQGYGVTEQAVRMQLSRHADELVENKHYFSSVTKRVSGKNLTTHQTFWTRNGIVRLGFFIKSGNAKRFRDWAEDLIVNTTASAAQQPTNGGVVRNEWAEEVASFSNFMKPFGLFEGVTFVDVTDSVKRNNN